MRRRAAHAQTARLIDGAGASDAHVAPARRALGTEKQRPAPPLAQRVDGDVTLFSKLPERSAWQRTAVRVVEHLRAVSAVSAPSPQRCTTRNAGAPRVRRPSTAWSCAQAPAKRQPWLPSPALHKRRLLHALCRPHTSPGERNKQRRWTASALREAFRTTRTETCPRLPLRVRCTRAAGTPRCVVAERKWSYSAHLSFPPRLSSAATEPHRR